MSDIITRLREGRTDGTDLRWTVAPIHLEAAAEIERLRKTLKRITAAYNAGRPGAAYDIARAALKEPK